MGHPRLTLIRSAWVGFNLPPKPIVPGYKEKQIHVLLGAGFQVILFVDGILDCYPTTISIRDLPDAVQSYVNQYIKLRNEGLELYRFALWGSRLCPKRDELLRERLVVLELLGDLRPYDLKARRWNVLESK